MFGKEVDMNVFTMVFLIVTVAVLGEVLKSIFKNKSGKEVLERLENLSKQVDQFDQQLTHFEKRLKNVETITTSKDFNLNREFERLEQEA